MFWAYFADLVVVSCKEGTISSYTTFVLGFTNPDKEYEKFLIA